MIFLESLGQFDKSDCKHKTYLCARSNVGVFLSSGDVLQTLKEQLT